MTELEIPRKPRAGSSRQTAPHEPFDGTGTAALENAGSPGRERLLEDLVDELAAQTPAEAFRYMRRWHSGPLSLIHLHVMSVLQADGSIPMRTLAESLGVSQASATGIVDRMEQRGLIERRRDIDDRRVIRVELATGGRELLAGMTADRRSKIATLLGELTDDELDGFLRGMRALRAARDRFIERAATNAPTTDDEAQR
jgi:DNA-binding MarR family transcriptional regulator